MSFKRNQTPTTTTIRPHLVNTCPPQNERKDSNWNIWFGVLAFSRTGGRPNKNKSRKFWNEFLASSDSRFQRPTWILNWIVANSKNGFCWKKFFGSKAERFVWSPRSFFQIISKNKNINLKWVEIRKGWTTVRPNYYFLKNGPIPASFC